MIKRLLIFIFILTFALVGFSQDKDTESGVTKSDVPERIVASLDGLFKTGTSNNIYNLKHLDTYYYVLQKSVFVNVLITAELDKKTEELESVLKEKYNDVKMKYETYVAEMEKKTAEENLKIEAKNKKIKDENKKLQLKTFEKPEAPVYKKPDSFFNLYLRVVKDGETVQKFKSDIPYNGSVDLEYLSFGLILEPGKYDLLIAVDTYDDTEDGTLLAKIEVPKLTLVDITAPRKNIESSRPVFYKRINTLLEAEKRFTVVKNSYQIGIMKQKFYPYTGSKYEFRSGDTPILTFFMKGTKMVRKNPPWDLTGNISIFKGKKKVTVFKPVKLGNPYFFQPINLVGKGKKKLPVGEYTLSIGLIDNNQNGLKGKVLIPFSIVD